MDAYRIIVPIILSFGCELVDSSLGMGYGTTLTPLLLALGFEPMEIVPAVLFSESITGILAAAFHHGYGNVNLRTGSIDTQVAAVLTGFGLVGVLISIRIAVNVPAWVVRLYIGLLVLAVGATILLGRRGEGRFSWRRIAGLGFVAAFNKGISGGGYGPVVTGGQVLAGVRGPAAVGITSLAEGVVSAVGVLVYVVSGVAMPWPLALPLTAGAVLSVPLATWIVSRVPTERLTVLIGGMSIALGGYTLLQLII
jgi:uncharacterized protein